MDLGAWQSFIAVASRVSAPLCMQGRGAQGWVMMCLWWVWDQLGRATPDCECLLSTLLSASHQGATVLFLNATDMDRSREYGQESIIYSLEGSSHFRINARSGEPPYVLFLFSFQFHLQNFPWFSSP